MKRPWLWFYGHFGTVGIVLLAVVAVFVATLVAGGAFGSAFVMAAFGSIFAYNEGQSKLRKDEASARRTAALAVIRDLRARGLDIQDATPEQARTIRLGLAASE
jgi:hypothetical protein